MVTSASLKARLEERIRTIEELTSGVSEEQAGKAPAEGEWCVKEVLSHLAGPETQSFYDSIRVFLEQDNPTNDLTPGRSFFDAKREGASIAELRTSVIDQYKRVGDLLSGLSEEQLSRTAHMPNFKKTPIGEYPTLGSWADVLINYHLSDHINQIQRLCR
ncbi:MAG: DinB family protein [Chloroflexi bacterium]|nr:DinB family protein [Chloroflexota bacterium]